MSIIISIANQKGGVGKTTTAVNLAHALTLRPCNKKVLVIDMDPQYNASSILGTIPANDQTKNVTQLFSDEYKYSSDCIVPSKYKNLDLIPSCLDLFVCGSSIGLGDPAAFMCLSKKIDDNTLNNYDFILIDCRPDIGGVYLNNAIACSDYYLIPVEGGSLFSLTGVQQFITAISQVSSYTARKLKMLGILVTMCEKRTLSYTTMINILEEKFGDLVFTTKIPRSADISKSHFAHASVIDNYPRSISARSYKGLAIEILQRCSLVDDSINDFIKNNSENVLEETIEG